MIFKAAILNPNEPLPSLNTVEPLTQLLLRPIKKKLFALGKKAAQVENY